MRYSIILVAATLAISCGKDTQNNSNNGTTPDTGLTNSPDAGTDGGEEVSDVGAADAGDDAGGSDCLQVAMNLDTFRVTYEDDVSIEYSASLEPEIFGQERELSLLFERYNSSVYIGTFELGTNEDDNFGTCTHCLFVRGNSNERAWFADAGTFVSNTNPYSRRVDLSLMGLRLIEVGVDPFTRESAPLADGRCIEVADFAQEGVYPVESWTCPPEQYGDNTECNCECGAVDPDCGGEIACLPGDPGCTPRPALPTANCGANEVCAFDPTGFTNVCTEACDWEQQTGCASANDACVFDFGVGDGDLCLPADGDRVEPNTQIGQDCQQKNLQVLCNVVDGFAQGYCGPNNVCRAICTSNDECTEPDHTCRIFSSENALGYCGPEPVDG